MWSEGGTHAGPQALCIINVFSRLPGPAVASKLIALLLSSTCKAAGEVDLRPSSMLY